MTINIKIRHIFTEKFHWNFSSRWRDIIFSSIILTIFIDLEIIQPIFIDVNLINIIWWMKLKILLWIKNLTIKLLHQSYLIFSLSEMMPAELQNVILYMLYTHLQLSEFLNTIFVKKSLLLLDRRYSLTSETEVCYNFQGCYFLKITFTCF